MGFAQKAFEQNFEKVDYLKREFFKADERFRSYRLIKSQNRIETVFERLRQEKSRALARYKKAILENQIAVINGIMLNQLSLAHRILQSIQETGLKPFIFWILRKI